jgi:hypothetical protein
MIYDLIKKYLVPLCIFAILFSKLKEKLNFIDFDDLLGPNKWIFFTIIVIIGIIIYFYFFKKYDDGILLEDCQRAKKILYNYNEKTGLHDDHIYHIKLNLGTQNLEYDEEQLSDLMNQYHFIIRDQQHDSDFMFLIDENYSTRQKIVDLEKKILKLSHYYGSSNILQVGQILRSRLVEKLNWILDENTYILYDTYNIKLVHKLDTNPKNKYIHIENNYYLDEDYARGIANKETDYNLTFGVANEDNLDLIVLCANKSKLIYDLTERILNLEKMIAENNENKVNKKDKKEESNEKNKEKEEVKEKEKENDIDKKEELKDENKEKSKGDTNDTVEEKIKA